MRRLIGLCAFFLAGCSSSPFVGTWQPTDDGQFARMLLTLDTHGGVYGSETPPGGRSADFSGIWNSPRSGEATLSILNPPPPLTWQAILHDGDQMRLTRGERVVNLKRLR